MTWQQHTMALGAGVLVVSAIGDHYEEFIFATRWPRRFDFPAAIGVLIFMVGYTAWSFS